MHAYFILPISGMMTLLAFAGFSGRQAALSAAEPPRIPPGAYGTNIHMIDRVGEDMENHQTVLESMKKAGCIWGRSDNYWRVYEREDGTWDFSDPDRFFQLANRIGVKILPVICAADLHVPKQYKPLSQHLPEYRKYLEKFVSRYHKQVKCWEISNEPDAGGPNTRIVEHKDPRKFMDLLSLSFQTIKAIDPEAVVVPGGMCGSDNDLVNYAYLEQLLKLGLAKNSDVINIHPYLDSNLPEEIYPQGLQRLHALLKKYGADQKPIWVTELGDSIGTPPDWKRYYQIAFEKAKINPAKTDLIVIEDPQWHFFTEGWMLNEETFGVKFRAKKAIRLKDLDKVPSDSVLLLGTNGDFPSAYLSALQRYLKRGGTIVSAWVMPLYFDIALAPDGTIRRTKISEKNNPPLHIGWEAFWTKKGVPSNFRNLKSDEPEMTGWRKFNMAGRFLSEQHLQKGDQFIPLVYAEEKAMKYPVAGVYRFNSQLKGNAIVSLMWGYPFKARTSHSSAKSWPRAALLLHAGGVDKVFSYKYRINKNRKRQDYGLHDWDLKKQDTAIALDTFFEVFPEKTKFSILHRHSPWIAKAVRPDGKTVHAVWLRQGKAKFQLHFDRPVEKAIDYLGKPLVIEGDCLEISDGPTYFIGPEKLTLP
ncbi:MAG: hypothetical protein PHS41_03935 [Victivallaceae bacterium]|nr:hypothetical protein [Victivallaceae bacterium]